MDRNVILTKSNTAFLKFTKESLIHRELTLGVKEDEEEEDPNELLLQPKYVTEVTSDKTFSLKEKQKFYKL